MNQPLSQIDTLQRGSARIPTPRSGDPDSIDLRSLARALLRRWKMVFGTSLLAAALVFLIVSISSPSYSAQAKIIVDPRRAEVLTTSALATVREPSPQVINSEIAILTSYLLIEEVIRTIGLDRLAPLDPSPPKANEAQRIEGLVWAIREELAVWSEADSFVITLSFSASNPELARDVLNTLANRYLSLQVESRRESIGQAAGWLEEQIEALEKQIATSEETISEMRTESLLKNGSTLDNATQQISTLNNQLVSASSARVTAEAELQQLTDLLERGGFADAAAVVSSPTLEVLRAQALDLRQQDAVWADSVAPDHPRRAPILSDLRQVEENILAEVRNVIEVRRGEYEVARLREQSLEESVARMEERVMQISGGEIGLRQLERETETVHRTHEAMLSRLTEARTQERVQRAEAKLIEKATLPSGPSAPRPKLMGVVTGATVFTVSVLALFFSEMTATTFRSARELEAETGLPVLAVLPRVAQGSDLGGFASFHGNAYSSYAEQVRQLRTMLLMHDESVISTSVAVLSSKAGEGKTATALALASMAVRAQRPAIVVDCDLRRSSLCRQFGWDMEYDFSSYLSGRCNLDQAIYSPTGLGFDVLTSAGSHLDLADELSTLWLQPVIDHLKDTYEVIIIDVPPLLSVSDAIIISRAADKRIYIAEHDKTQRSDLRHGLDILADFQLPVDGLVLNKATGQGAGMQRDG